MGPTPSPNLSEHVHRLIIENKTKKGHNLVCWHQKNYPYHTEFVSWRVDHFSFFFLFSIISRWTCPNRFGEGVGGVIIEKNKFVLKWFFLLENRPSLTPSPPLIGIFQYFFF